MIHLKWEGRSYNIVSKKHFAKRGVEGETGAAHSDYRFNVNCSLVKAAMESNRLLISLVH